MPMQISFSDLVLDDFAGTPLGLRQTTLYGKSEKKKRKNVL